MSATNPCFFNQFLSEIRFFRLIWKFANNRQKIGSKSTAPLMSQILMVSKAGDDGIATYFKGKKRFEIVFKNRTWHIKWEVSRKLFVYIGVNGFHSKYLKFGCKGFDNNQNEAEKLERGSCCQGVKYHFISGDLSSLNVKSMKTY